MSENRCYYGFVHFFSVNFLSPRTNRTSLKVLVRPTFLYARIENKNNDRKKIDKENPRNRTVWAKVMPWRSVGPVGFATKYLGNDEEIEMPKTYHC